MLVCLHCSSPSESYPCIPSLSASLQALEQQCPEMKPKQRVFNGHEVAALPSRAWLLLAWFPASITEACAISEVALQVLLGSHQVVWLRWVFLLYPE